MSCFVRTPYNVLLREDSILFFSHFLLFLFCIFFHRRELFTDVLVPRHPPVFHEWFLKEFPDPAKWYRARQAYVRTAAVMSMVGYVLGLGDRHCENILFDGTSGETCHVDFNCLFNKGEKFKTPERVPFRLTHNMVDAMGTNGYEVLVLCIPPPLPPPAHTHTHTPPPPPPHPRPS
jgi:hypothetical protein